MNTFISQMLCDRANDINDMILFADEQELKHNKEGWDEELAQIQIELNAPQKFDTLKACDVVLVLYSIPNQEGYSSTHIHGSLSDDEVYAFIQQGRVKRVTIHHIAR